MKQTEKILGVLILLLIISRLFFSYPFSALAITLAMMLLSMIYFALSFGLLNNIRLRNLFKSESYKGISIMRIFGTVFTGFVLSSVVVYSLFKFQRWPFGNEGLLISLSGLLIVIIVVLLKFIMTKKNFYFNSLYRLGIIGIIATSLYFVSSESLLEMQYRNDPEYVEAEKKLMKDPTNKELLKKANKKREEMDLDE